MANVSNSNQDFSIGRSLLSLTGSLAVSGAIGAAAHYITPIIPMKGSVITSLTLGTATYLGQTLAGPEGSYLNHLILTTACVGFAALALTQGAPILAAKYALKLPVPMHMLAIGATNLLGQTFVVWLSRPSSSSSPNESDAIPEEEVKKLKEKYKNPEDFEKATKEDLEELRAAKIVFDDLALQCAKEQQEYKLGMEAPKSFKMFLLPPENTDVIKNLSAEKLGWFKVFYENASGPWSDLAPDCQLAFRQHAEFFADRSIRLPLNDNEESRLAIYQKELGIYVDPSKVAKLDEEALKALSKLTSADEITVENVANYSQLFGSKGSNWNEYSPFMQWTFKSYAPQLDWPELSWPTQVEYDDGKHLRDIDFTIAKHFYQRLWKENHKNSNEDVRNALIQAFYDHGLPLNDELPSYIPSIELPDPEKSIIQNLGDTQIKWLELYYDHHLDKWKALPLPVQYALAKRTPGLPHPIYSIDVDEVKAFDQDTIEALHGALDLHYDYELFEATKRDEDHEAHKTQNDAFFKLSSDERHTLRKAYISQFNKYDLKIEVTDDDEKNPTLKKFENPSEHDIETWKGLINNYETYQFNWFAAYYEEIPEKWALVPNAIQQAFKTKNASFPDPINPSDVPQPPKPPESGISLKTPEEVYNLDEEAVKKYYADFKFGDFIAEGDNANQQLQMLQAFRAMFLKHGLRLFDVKANNAKVIDFEKFKKDELTDSQRHWLYVIFKPVVSSEKQDAATQTAINYWEDMPCLLQLTIALATKTYPEVIDYDFTFPESGEISQLRQDQAQALYDQYKDRPENWLLEAGSKVDSLNSKFEELGIPKLDPKDGITKLSDDFLEEFHDDADAKKYWDALNRSTQIEFHRKFMKSGWKVDNFDIKEETSVLDAAVSGVSNLLSFWENRSES